MSVLRPIVFAFQGSSLTTGYLSADWVPKLVNDLQLYPEAVGPIWVYNMGKGSQTSAWGVTNAPFVSALRPTHIVTEGFAINDCVVTAGVPAISRSDHITNIQTMVAGWRAANPSVDISIQTMNPVSAIGVALRPNLADYYADEIATGTTLGIRRIDNYAGWPNPLPQVLTHVDPSTGLGDGLHPIWTGGVDTYLYPNILQYCRDRMLEFWGGSVTGQLDFSRPSQSGLITVI